MVQLVLMNVVANHIACSVRRLSERIICCRVKINSEKSFVSFDQ